MIPWQVLAAFVVPFVGVVWFLATKLSTIESKIDHIASSHGETKERVERLEERVLQ
jgi:hypothetical protein